ncbi:MAG: hypothetical protein H7Y17_05660 [Chlorobia bacterium]|nr:hypothetical protein [Fimbriimonadaceae bacterium]
MIKSERIKFAIYFNPAWLDRHEVEENVCLVSIPSYTYRLYAIARTTDAGVLYEPLYAMLMDREPRIKVLKDCEKWAVGDEVELGYELPEFFPLQVLDESSAWVEVRAVPHLVLYNPEEENDEQSGLAIGYTLPEIKKAEEISWGPDLAEALPHMMRTIYRKDRNNLFLPQFFLWTY